MKHVLASLDPFAMGFVRVALAGLFGLPVLVRAGTRGLAVFLDKEVWILALLNAFAVTLLHLGMDLTTASKTSLLINVNIAFVAVLSVWLLKEALGSRQIAGVGLGLVGVVLLGTEGDPASMHGGEATGDALVFASAILAAVSIVWTKRLLAKHEALTLAVAVLLIAALPLAAASSVLGGPIVLAPLDWAVMVWLAGVSTLVAVLLWTFALGGLGATVSSLLLTVQVFVAAGLAVFLLGDPLTPVIVVGGALILGSVHLASVRR
jgi:drug/metabolite transporter (DMT)-like permease